MSALDRVIAEGKDAWIRLVIAAHMPNKPRTGEFAEKVVAGQKTRDYIIILRGNEIGIYYLYDGAAPPGEIVPYIPRLIQVMREHGFEYDAQKFLFCPRPIVIGLVSGTILSGDPDLRPFEPVAYPVTQERWEFMHGLVIVGLAIKVRT